MLAGKFLLCGSLKQNVAWIYKVKNSLFVLPFASFYCFFVFIHTSLYKEGQFFLLILKIMTESSGIRSSWCDHKICYDSCEKTSGII